MIHQLNKELTQSSYKFKGNISEHHIIPGNMINSMLQTACEPQNREITKRQIEKFLNQNPEMQLIFESSQLYANQS